MFNPTSMSCATEYTWATLYSEGLCSHIVLLRLVGDIKLHKDALALVLCVTNDNVEASHDWHHHTQGAPGACTSFDDDEPTCGQGGRGFVR